MTSVQPKQGGEKVSKTQPPPEPKPSTEPKGNEASVSNRDQKKKKIGEDDTDSEEDVYKKDPAKPFQKKNLLIKTLKFTDNHNCQGIEALYSMEVC